MSDMNKIRTSLMNKKTEVLREKKRAFKYSTGDRLKWITTRRGEYEIGFNKSVTSGGSSLSGYSPDAVSARMVALTTFSPCITLPRQKHGFVVAGGGHITLLLSNMHIYCGLIHGGHVVVAQEGREKARTCQGLASQMLKFYTLEST